MPFAKHLGNRRDDSGRRVASVVGLDRSDGWRGVVVEPHIGQLAGFNILERYAGCASGYHVAVCADVVQWSDISFPS